MSVALRAVEAAAYKWTEAQTATGDEKAQLTKECWEFIDIGRRALEFEAPSRLATDEASTTDRELQK